MSKMLSQDDYPVADELTKKLFCEDIQTEQPICTKYFGEKQEFKISPKSLAERQQTPKKQNYLVGCGTFMPRTGSKTYKSQKMNYKAFFSPQSVYSALCKRKISKVRANNLEYSQSRQTTVEGIFELAGKSKISDLSSHLAVNLMDSLFYSTTNHNSKMKLYAPTCLLLAAKTIELDEKIPYLWKLKQYANSTFEFAEFKKAEIVLLENVDWNPQFTSLLEFVEFFLSQGVVFSSDDYFDEEDDKEVLKENTQSLNKQNSQNKEKLGNGAGIMTATKKMIQSENGKKIEAESFLNKPNATLDAIATKIGSLSETRILEIVGKIESAAGKLCNAVVKHIDFVETDPVVLACACIAYLREIHGILPRWCGELEELTRIRGNLVYDIVDSLHRVFDKLMVPEQTFQAPRVQNPLQSLKAFLIKSTQPAVLKPNCENKITEVVNVTCQPKSLPSFDRIEKVPVYVEALKCDLKVNHSVKQSIALQGFAPPSYNELLYNIAPQEPERQSSFAQRIYTDRNSTSIEKKSGHFKVSLPRIIKNHPNNPEISHIKTASLQIIEAPKKPNSNSILSFIGNGRSNISSNGFQHKLLK